MKSDARTRGPGLAKTRGDRLFQRRALELWASVPGAMAELVRAADVVSEGDTREEAGARRYFGSTLLLFEPDPRRGVALGELLSRLEADPHFRLQALRVAVREAAHRAGAAMGPVSAEISFRRVERGFVVAIDLEAPIESRGARTA